VRGMNEIKKLLRLPATKRPYNDDVIRQIDEAIMDMARIRRQRRIALARIRQGEKNKTNVQ
jgi:hypothetical protein